MLMAMCAEVEEVLQAVRGGRLSINAAARRLRLNSITEVRDFARLDSFRAARSGIPEIILAEGKSPEKVVMIAKAAKSPMLITRMGNGHTAALKKAFPKMTYNRSARSAFTGSLPAKSAGRIGVLAAGTSDVPIAEEAAFTAEAMGCEALRAYDVGVAGIHRLFKPLKSMVGKGARAFVVAAGREGTLPAIVAGLVDVPVIGLPISTGYGYGGKGEAALKSMLQSCSFLTVVNIDNGVGAGACAALIAKKAVGK